MATEASSSHASKAALVLFRSPRQLTMTLPLSPPGFGHDPLEAVLLDDDVAAGTDLHGQFTAELLEVGAEPPQGAPIQPAYRRIAERRDNKIARVAAARKLLTLVFYGMRDGRIRCLQEAG